MTRLLLLALVLLPANAALLVKNLQVEYQSTPLGIDVEKPRFNWQLASTAAERAVSQSAYQITVRDPKGATAWDSGRVSSPHSVAIPYVGAPLLPATRYSFTVTVWPNSGPKLSSSSWFETGLMDPSPNSPRWSGAQWIGGSNSDLVLYAPYLAVFDLSYSVTIAPGSTRASFIYGANDSRLMDKFKNIYQVQSPRDASYIKLELDLSTLPSGKAKLNVYRAGYKDTDNPSTPFKTFEIDPAVINASNAHAEHTISFRSTFGQIALSIDGKTTFAGAPPQPAAGAPPQRFGRGQQPNAVNLNPVGSGGNFLPFGMLCDIGFSLDANQSAAFRNLQVRNNRAPNNVLFEENLSASPYAGIFAKAPGLTVSNGSYVLTGGAAGVLIARDPSRNSPPLLRTTFNLSKPVASARLYITARGIYEASLNGRRIGDDHFNPGLTQYNLTHLYQTYDVTSLLKPGPNALSSQLGEGWWSGLLSFGAVWNHFGDRQSLLAKLAITYADGSTETIVTNPSTWKINTRGPIVYSSLDFGEVYDARREAALANPSNWSLASAVPLQGTAFIGSEIGFGGRPGTSIQYDKLQLTAQIGNNAGVFKILTAKSVKQVRPGVFVYDLGQNIVGVPRITIAAGRPGARLTLRFAEMLYPDLKESGKNVGMIMTENYRAALSQDVFTMKAGPQTFQPRLTSHGFQYIEITGIEKPLPLAAVQGVAISSIRELTADYKSSNEKVNRLWSNLVWSNIDNFLSIPTDCPQRNERMGWSGDLNVFSRTATYVSNADQFLTRHMIAMRDTQTPAGRFADVAPVGGGFGGVLWGSAGIVVPYEAYLQYNDKRLLETNYPAMAAYAAHLESSIDPKTGLSSDAALGDWLGPQNNALGSAFLATAYHAFDMAIMADVAAVLGKPDDAAKYRRLYEARKAFFNKTFVNADRKTMGLPGGRGFGGPGARGQSGPPEFKLADTQTSYAVGLAMDLFDSTIKLDMIRNLADTVTRQNKDDGGVLRPAHSLMTGFIGTAWISKALSDSGRSDLAYKLLLNNQYPSWLYPIDQGATTIWERLNGYTVENGFGGNNSMNSFNHYSFGAVGQWMMAYSLGIQRDEPGFRKFILQPTPDPNAQLTSAQGHYDSPYGRIQSAWKLLPGTLAYTATVPPNTEATLHLPTPDPASVREGQRPAASAPGVKFVKYENGKAVYTLSSGSYAFTAAR